MAEIRRIGFLADTHSNKADGSDLPQQALDAFAGVDLIVHLGDIGRKGILDRLGEVAPVLVPSGDGKGYVPAGALGEAEPVKVVDASGVRVGIVFNVANPDKKLSLNEMGAVEFPDVPLDWLLNRRFGGPVDVVAFGGTHRQLEQQHEGVLFINPGSPTLPSDRRDDNDLGSVAVLDLSGGAPKVELLRLRKG
jgi:putative phosphoesterase